MCEPRHLGDLRVLELRQELEKRGLDKNGVKALLIERLEQALRNEGKDPSRFDFDATKKVGSTTSIRRPANGEEKYEMDDGGGIQDQQQLTNESSGNVRSSHTPLSVNSDTKVDSPSLLLAETDIKSEFVDDDTTPAPAPASWSTQTITTDNFDHLRVKDERLSIETSTTPVNTMMTNELDDNNKQQTMDDENCDDSAPDSQHQQQQQSGEQPSLGDDDNQSAAGKSNTVDGNNTASSGRSLWVKGLSPSTKAADLKALFSRCGHVVTAKIYTNKKQPGSTCLGHLTMLSAEQATQCIQKMHRTSLKGRTISGDDLPTLDALKAAAAPVTITPAVPKRIATTGKKSTQKETSSTAKSQSHKKTPQAASSAAALKRAKTNQKSKTTIITHSSPSIRRIVRRSRSRSSSSRRRHIPPSSHYSSSLAARRAIAPPSRLVPMQMRRAWNGSQRGGHHSMMRAGRDHYRPMPPPMVRSIEPHWDRREMLEMMRRKEEEHRKREEELRMQRERERLKFEREKLEREKLELQQLRMTQQQVAMSLPSAYSTGAGANPYMTGGGGSRPRSLAESGYLSMATAMYQSSAPQQQQQQQRMSATNIRVGDDRSSRAIDSRRGVGRDDLRYNSTSRGGGSATTRVDELRRVDRRSTGSRHDERRTTPYDRHSPHQSAPYNAGRDRDDRRGARRNDGAPTAVTTGAGYGRSNIDSGGRDSRPSRNSSTTTWGSSSIRGGSSGGYGGATRGSTQPDYAGANLWTAGQVNPAAAVGNVASSFASGNWQRPGANLAGWPSIPLIGSSNATSVSTSNNASDRFDAYKYGGGSNSNSRRY